MVATGADRQRQQLTLRIGIAGRERDLSGGAFLLRRRLERQVGRRAERDDAGREQGQKPPQAPILHGKRLPRHFPAPTPSVRRRPVRRSIVKSDQSLSNKTASDEALIEHPKSFAREHNESFARNSG